MRYGGGSLMRHGGGSLMRHGGGSCVVSQQSWFGLLFLFRKFSNLLLPPTNKYENSILLSPPPRLWPMPTKPTVSRRQDVSLRATSRECATPTYFGCFMWERGRGVWVLSAGDNETRKSSYFLASFCKIFQFYLSTFNFIGNPFRTLRNTSRVSFLSSRWMRWEGGTLVINWAYDHMPDCRKLRLFHPTGWWKCNFQSIAWSIRSKKSCKSSVFLLSFLPLFIICVFLPNRLMECFKP